MKGNYQFFDVFGLDPELLAMVPQPAIALLLLFPITENVSCRCSVTGVFCLVRRCV